MEIKGDYTSNEVWHVTGRGDVYVVTNEKTRKHEEFSNWRGEYVRINGCTFKVLSMDLFATMTIYEGFSMGILVEKAREIDETLRKK